MKDKDEKVLEEATEKITEMSYYLKRKQMGFPEGAEELRLKSEEQYFKAIDKISELIHNKFGAESVEDRIFDAIVDIITHNNIHKDMLKRMGIKY